MGMMAVQRDELAQPPPINELDRQRSHDSQNTGGSGGGVMSTVMNWLSTNKSSSSQNSNADRGSAASNKKRVRKVGLKARSKGVRDGNRAHRSGLFETNMGLRTLPRRIYPLRPTPDMIRKARRGALTKFLRQGEVVRADMYGDVVNPRTATLQIAEGYDFETDHLSDEDDSMDEDLKTTANLYYISVRKDELPTYHFWRKNAELDPLLAERPIDWGAIFTEQLSTLPDAEVGVPKKPVGAPDNKSMTVVNEWTPGQKYYQDFNPKRSVRPALRNSTAAISTATTAAKWQVQGSIADLVWNTSNNGITEGSRQSGPQPGDPEWESAEMEWERQIRDAKSLKEFFAQYKREEGEKYAELTAWATSPPLHPIPGEDAGIQAYNAVWKTAIPTIAFKLTQQQFGRPVTPLKGNEPRCRDEDPTNWNLGNKSEDRPSYIRAERIYHQEQPLEFLDFYDQKSHGQPMLRSKFPA